MSRSSQERERESEEDEAEDAVSVVSVHSSLSSLFGSEDEGPRAMEAEEVDWNVVTLPRVFEKRSDSSQESLRGGEGTREREREDFVRGY